MNIFDIIKNLYTNNKLIWLKEVDDSDIQPYVIQRFLVMNDSLRVYTRWLDKYVFTLSPRMYLSLAWSVIPKTNKQPFVKYIKQKDDDEKYNDLFMKIRKHFEMADNDFNIIKERLIESINKDKVSWFKFYGMEKRFWKDNLVDFEQMRKTNNIRSLVDYGTL